MRRRGIFLIVTLLMVAVLAMMLTAAVKLLPASTTSASQFSDDEAALLAAEAGVHYAVARLEANFKWCGAGPTQTGSSGLVVDQPGLKVMEDNGNVWGFVTDPDGHQSQFRMRFNYQDGSPGHEGLNDPSSTPTMPLRYVSVNNLTNFTSAVPDPRSNGAPGWAVPNPLPSPYPYQVPYAQVCLQVEGLAGPGLQGTGPSNPLPSPGSHRHVATRMIEAYYSQKAPGFSDAVLGAGGSVNFTFPGSTKASIQLDSTDSNQQIRARSAHGFEINGGDTSANVTVAQKGQTGLVTYSGVDPENVAPGSGVTGQSNPSPQLMQLKWSSLTLPDSSLHSTSTVELKAGTYVWDAALGELLYYKESLHQDDPTWDPSVSSILSNPTTLVSSVLNSVPTVVGSQFAATRSDYVGNTKALTWAGAKGSPVNITVANDLNVQPQTVYNPLTGTSHTISGVSFISTDQSTPVNFNFTGPKSGTYSMHVPGRVYFDGSLKGQGVSLISDKSISVVNGGVNLSVDPSAKTGVNLYAKGDISISTATSGAKKGGTNFQDLSLTGVVYTWGNFSATLDNTSATKAGNFNVSGALVAYGDNPIYSGSNPLGGDIDVTAGSAKAKYDSSYFGGVTGATSGRLVKIFWAVR